MLTPGDLQALWLTIRLATVVTAAFGHGTERAGGPIHPRAPTITSRPWNTLRPIDLPP